MVGDVPVSGGSMELLPLMRAYASGLLETDKCCGWTLVGDAVITSKGLTSFGRARDAVLRQVRSGEEALIILGDSGVFGWDSNYISEADPVACMFRYWTLGDIASVFSERRVLNLSVPGYSSQQILTRLLRFVDGVKELRRMCFVWYGGNNDGMIMDCAPGSEFASCNAESVCSPSLTQRSMMAGLNEVRRRGGDIIFLRPRRRLDWPPGVLSVKRGISVRIHSPAIASRMAMAADCYREGRLEEAAELDCVLPRLRTELSSVFDDMAREAKLVDCTAVTAGMVERQFFVDYCHFGSRAGLQIFREVARMAGDAIVGTPRLSPRRRPLWAKWRALIARTRPNSQRKQNESSVYPLW